MGIKYFFDNYAIIEMIKYNLDYLDFIDEEITLTIFNLAEIYCSLLKDYGEEKANTLYDNYKDSIVEIPDEVLKQAMKFKIKHKKKRLSYTDCLGYVYALNSNLIFLTGDKEFENMQNVKFVK